MDPHRCIGCHACEHACRVRDAQGALDDPHRVRGAEHVANRPGRVYALPQPDMRPTSCPADAISRIDRQVMTARKPRCIACSNCVLACPFGVPKMMAEFDLMMKCDMCYDRTSTGRKPMCRPSARAGP